MNYSNQLSDDELIQALSKEGGEREKTVDYLMKNYIHYVPTIAKKIGLSHDLAIDTFTDAIMDLIEQVTKGKFKGESKLSSYFYKIFYFKSIDLFRKNTTNRVEYKEDLPDVSDSAPSVIKKLETREDVNQLNVFLDQMEKPCKQILIDWGFWGYSMSEIAERAGLKDSIQAKDRKYQCLKKLRKLME